MTIRDKYGNIIGVTYTNGCGDQIVRDQLGNQVGTVTENGVVYDEHGNVIATVH